MKKTKVVIPELDSFASNHAMQKYEDKIVSNVKAGLEIKKDDEIIEKLRMLAEEYVDFNARNLSIVGDYKLNKSTVKFYLCEEVVDRKKAFNKILHLFNDENLSDKLTSLRSYGYTAKLIKEI